jgi:hypothetical protein
MALKQSSKVGFGSSSIAHFSASDPSASQSHLARPPSGAIPLRALGSGAHGSGAFASSLSAAPSLRKAMSMRRGASLAQAASQLLVLPQGDPEPPRPEEAPVVSDSCCMSTVLPLLCLNYLFSS